MLQKITLLAHLLLAISRAQQIGTLAPEVHPPLTWQKCTTAAGCTTMSGGGVVLDASSREILTVGGQTSCFSGNYWNATICPDGVTCAKNCALEGANYGFSGVSTNGNSIHLQFPNGGASENFPTRVYLAASNTTYQIFKVLNQEFSFDVDLSTLSCGYSGALYFSQMDADGGMSKYPNNKAGAQYGTGYCDSLCPKNLKFIDGQANSLGWAAPTSTDSGGGGIGSCCSEMDVWEANEISAVFAPHTCNVNGQTSCSGNQCGGTTVAAKYTGFCDPDGCDYNTYRLGDKTFYGQTLDTSKIFTVVTQFITSNNTPAGNLTEIRRLYVQNGKVIQNPPSAIAGTTLYNSISDNFCVAQKTAFSDYDSFENHGGMTAMGKSLSAGMVLVMSLSYNYANALKFDGDYPSNTSAPGFARGTCPTTAPIPPPISPPPVHAVTFSNIRFGDIGSTYSGTVTGTTTSTPPKSTSSTTSTTATASGPTQTKYGQCGGTGYVGPTVCSGSTCTYSNPYYAQCL